MAIAASLRQLTLPQRLACAYGAPEWRGLVDDLAALDPGADVYAVGAPILGLLPSAEDWAGVGFPGTGEPGDTRPVPPWTPRLYRCPEALRPAGPHPALVLVRAGHPGIGDPSKHYVDEAPWWSLVPCAFVLEKGPGGSGPAFVGRSFRQLSEFNRWWDSDNQARALPWPVGHPLGGKVEHTPAGSRWRYPGELAGAPPHPAGSYELVADPYTPPGRPG